MFLQSWRVSRVQGGDAGEADDTQQADRGKHQRRSFRENRGERRKLRRAELLREFELVVRAGAADADHEAEKSFEGKKKISEESQRRFRRSVSR